jgi:hypothetical protein
VHTWAGAILENAKLDNGRYCLLFFIQQNRKSLLSIIKLVLIVAKIITIRRISKKNAILFATNILTLTIFYQQVKILTPKVIN